MKSANAQSVARLTRRATCNCASRFDISLARIADYTEFKKLLDKGRHPAFIGRSNFECNCNNGGAIFYRLEGEVIAVSLINPHFGILLALNVHPAHRSHGLGAAVINFLVPNFARVVEHKVKWFEGRGYRRIGSLKKGISLNTQLMARAELFKLAGRLNRVWGNRKV